MTVVVLDASAMVELLLARPGADAVGGAITGRDVVAPGHFDAEVLGGLFRAERLGMAKPSVIEGAVRQLGSAPIDRLVVAGLVTDAWAMRRNLSAADALYVALALKMDAPLITADRALAAAPLKGISITVVG